LTSGYLSPGLDAGHSLHVYPDDDAHDDRSLQCFDRRYSSLLASAITTQYRAAAPASSAVASITTRPLTSRSCSGASSRVVGRSDSKSSSSSSSSSAMYQSLR